MGLSQVGVDHQSLCVQCNGLIVLLQLAVRVAHVVVRHGVGGILLDNTFKGFDGFLVVPGFEITVALLILHLHLLWAGLLFHGLIPWTAAGTTGTTSVGSCQQRCNEQQTTTQDDEPRFPRHGTFSYKFRICKDTCGRLYHLARMYSLVTCCSKARDARCRPPMV